jgi:hypothetical protein
MKFENLLGAGEFGEQRFDADCASLTRGDDPRPAACLLKNLFPFAEEEARVLEKGEVKAENARA